MGWCSATEYVDGVWELVKDHLPADKKAEIGKAIVEIFEAGDWDCQNESDMVNELMELDDEFYLEMSGFNDGWVDNEEELREELEGCEDDKEKIERLVKVWKANKTAT